MQLPQSGTVGSGHPNTKGFLIVLIVLSDLSFSEIREHSHHYDHVFTSDDFKVIGQCSHGRNLRSLESLHIHLKPE